MHIHHSSIQFHHHKYNYNKNIKNNIIETTTQKPTEIQKILNRAIDKKGQGRRRRVYGSVLATVHCVFSF